KELRQMAASYGFDISTPATSAQEAVQWLYFGYLAGVKEQNGAAMSLGRTSTFLDVYFARDLAAGRLTEEAAQDIIDDFVIMRRTWGDDGAIACCVSPMLVGKQMQFFGARANLAKCFLYAINGGRDEISGDQVGPAFAPIAGEYLEFDEVLAKFDAMMDWLA